METPRWIVMVALDLAEQRRAPQRTPEFVRLLRTLPIGPDTPMSEVRRHVRMALGEQSE